MRKFWLATSAAALVLSLAGGAHAEDQNPGSAPNLAPASKASNEGLMFSKDAPAATPMAPPSSDTAAPASANPAQDAAAPAQASPVPAQPTVAMAPVLPEDQPVADQLKDLAEAKLKQYVPREADRTGVLEFYRSRNFAPLWVTSGKVAPRTQQTIDFLHGVASDGLDPSDYPTPRFADSDPARLAAAPASAAPRSPA
jgi:murein L,D-transpeptidase YcbB/YkuD